MNKYKLMEGLSDDIAFAEAINFYDSFTTPKLEELRYKKNNTVDTSVAGSELVSQIRELETKEMKDRETWIRAMIVDYNRDDFPDHLKENIAKQVGEYIIKSAIDYIARTS
tara:strand:- start:3591 stop:3923 length:333 start_codon:yes stop_codon:yes gene_type:complete